MSCMYVCCVCVCAGEDREGEEGQYMCVVWVGGCV